MTHRPTPRRDTTARPFALQQIAQACALMLMAGAAMAQGTAPAADTAAPSVSLPAVTVKASAPTSDTLAPAAPGGQVATGARLGVLGNVSVMDAPFNVTAFTAEGIANTQAKTVGAVLKKDPSVRMTTNEGHIVENFLIRGFPVSSGSIAVNGVFGLAPEQNTPVEMFERVEVLKGPGAVAMGLPPSGDVGGVINLITKRADKVPLTRFTTTWLSKSNLGLHADIGRRVGEDQRLGIRFNGVLTSGETWLDHQTKKRQVGHVAIDYQGNDWSIDADIYSVHNRVRKGSPMQPVLNGWTTVPTAPDGSTNFFYGEDVYSNTNTRGATVHGQAKIANGWTAYAKGGSAKHSYGGFIFGTRPVFPAANAATGNATGTAYNSRGEYETNALEAGVRGQFNTGSVTHSTVLSATVTHYQGGSYGNGTAPINSNLYNPVPITMPAPTAAGTYSKFNDDTSRAVSAVDTLGFVDDKVKLTLGLRAQHIEQKLGPYEESAVAPLVGLVVQPWGNRLSLYGNYVEGLSAGTVVEAPYVNQGESFAPYKTKQMELGVKWAWDELTSTLSVFQITKPALIDVGTAPAVSQRVDGEQRNRGVEWNVFGKVTRNVSLLGGVAYIKAVQTKTANATNQGRLQVGVPRLALNLGSEYAVPFVPGLTVGGRVNHTGTQALSADNSVELPASTTVDLDTRYATSVSGTPVVLRASVTNLTNRAYFESVWGAGRVNVGAPRAFAVSASADF